MVSYFILVSSNATKSTAHGTLNNFSHSASNINLAQNSTSRTKGNDVLPQNDINEPTQPEFQPAQGQAQVAKLSWLHDIHCAFVMYILV